MSDENYLSFYYVIMLWKYGILHVTLVTLSVYHFGLLFGILALMFLYYAIKLVVSPLGYEFCTGNDLVHFYDSEKTPHNGLLYWEMDKVEFNQIKDNGFKEIAIHNIRRYSQVPVNILGFWFWKDVDKGLAYNQIQRCEIDIHSKEDLLKYADKLINIKIPLSKPQFFAKFIEDYTEGKSAGIMVFHHSFSDGNGIVNSLSFFNDSSHMPNLPTGRGLPWYYYLLYGLAIPVSLGYALPELYPKRWRDWSKIKSPKGNSGSGTNLISKEYNFEDLRMCYKKYERKTFNNYMMGILSKSIYHWYKQNNATDIGSICTIIPVAMKGFTSNIKELEMNNHSSGITYQFPLKENLEDAIEATKKGFDYYFSLAYIIYTVLMLKTFMLYPPALGRFLFQYFGRNLDLTFTNVQGFKEPMYIGNKKIHSLQGFLNVYGGGNLTIATNSYNTKVTVQMTADDQLQMDPKQLMKIIEENLDKKIAELSSQ